MNRSDTKQRDGLFCIKCEKVFEMNNITLINEDLVYAVCLDCHIGMFISHSHLFDRIITVGMMTDLTFDELPVLSLEPVSEDDVLEAHRMMQSDKFHF